MNETKPKLKYAAWLLTLIAVNNVIYLTPSLASGYYVVMAAGLLYGLAVSRAHITFNPAGILFWLACAVSIVANEVPAFFSPWQRLGTFVIVSGLLGPFLFSRELCRMRIFMFRAVNILFAVVIVASFLGLFCGVSRYHAYSGYFCGITTHSMLLGPISGCTVLYMFYQLYHWKNSGKGKKLFFLIVLFMSVCLLFGAASRSAFIATAVGVVVLHCIYVRNRKAKLYKIALFGILALVIFTPALEPYYAKLLAKNGNEEFLNFDSRADHWRLHWESFKENPLTGIGFSAIVVDPEINTLGDNGRVETGSSWLSILSMTGILGFCSFCFLLMGAFRILYRNLRRHELEVAFGSGLLSFWCVHMLAEGYVLSAGGLLFFSFWLLLGTIYSYDVLRRKVRPVAEARNLHE